MDTKISIIIPVYNTENFLRRCLDSCIYQTLEEIEIIVVNDASPDGSDMIMREYEEKYPEKIVCIYLEKNIRQGGARNVAIRCARGEFIMFVDSDDWIETEMCEGLYHEAMLSKADIVYCNNLRQRPDGSFLIENRFPNEAVGNVKENILGILTQPYVAPWASIIKKSIIVNNHLFFPENLVAEDTAITKLWDLHAKKITKIEGAYYVYCLNENSTGQAEMRDYRNDEYDCVKILYDNLMKCEKVNEYKAECSLICMRYALNFANNMLKRVKEKYYKQIAEGFRECSKHVCGNLTETDLWKYWFTPKERKFLLNGMDFSYCSEKHQISDVEDYKEYYEQLSDDIEIILGWFRTRGKKKIAIWGKTDYALGLNNVFAEMHIVDNAHEIKKNGIECVLCLRTLHIPNIRKQLSDKNVELFNLQGYLWTREDMRKFCYYADGNYSNCNRKGKV